MEYKDYYKTLGVTRDAKADEIKRVYRKLARKYHPDVSKEANAEEHFKEVQEAYEVLKDPEKRAAYDQLGSQWQNGQTFRQPRGHGQGFHSAGMSEEDLGGFSDFFSSIFGRANAGRQRPQQEFRQRGRDEHAKIQISLEEAFRGGEKTIQLQTPKVDANGQMQYETRSLKITIPPGIMSGQQLRLSKQGSPGHGNASAGDLYLEIDVLPHRLFTLQGRDVFLTLPLTPWEAALGAKIPVPTLGGKVEMKIAPGSQAGQKLRLKGRGLPGKPQAGDQYALLQIVVPLAHTEQDRHLYEKMAQEMPLDPRANLF